MVSHPRQHQTIYGREREQTRLRQLLDDAIDGRGALVLISGEAGIGKTTLVDCLIQFAGEQNCLVLTGGCNDFMTTPPYGPWVEIGRSIPDDPSLPSILIQLREGGRITGVGSQANLFLMLDELLSSLAAIQPLVIVLEDLHWSDPASLELLCYLGRHLTDRSMMVVATYRDDEVTRGSELYRVLPMLTHGPAARRLNLQPLGRASIEELIAARYELGTSDRGRLTDYLSRRSDGNPFFVDELLDALETEGRLYRSDEGWRVQKLRTVQPTALVTQVIEQRLSRLAPEARALFQIAAVLGQDVSLELWKTVAGVSGAELDRAIEPALENRLIEELPQGTGFRFHHALVREVLYGSTMLNQRRTLHRRIGEALLDAPNPDPDALADHFHRAGDARTAEWLIRAGNRAEKRYALRTAIERFEVAVALLEERPDNERCCGWLHFRLSRLKSGHDLPASLTHIEEALRAAERTRDRYLAARSLVTKGLLLCFTGNIRQGLVEMEHADEEERALAASGERTGLDYYAHHGFKQTTFELDPASLTFTEMVAMSGKGDTRDMRALWLCAIGRFREAQAIAEALFKDVQITEAELPYATAEQLQRSGERGSLALGYLRAWLGCPDDARFPLEYTFAYNRVHKSAYLPNGIHTALQVRVLPYLTEDLAERQRLTERCVEAAHLISDGQLVEHPFTHGAYAVELLEGRWGNARLILDQMMEMGGSREPSLLARAYRAGLARHQGEVDTARALIRDILPRGPETDPGDVEFRPAIMAQRVAIALALDAGDLETAHGWLVQHQRWLDWAEVVLGRCELDLLWARYHHLSKDDDAARCKAIRASERATDPRQPLALIAAHRFLGELETSAQNYTEAADYLDTSSQLADTCLAPFETARTRFASARLAAATGDFSRARNLLVQVRETCQSLGARPLLADVESLERLLAASTETYPGGLTKREAEVLGLVADGLSNRQIAEELFLSVRTVERHVSNIYRKIDARGRPDAIAYALHHRFASNQTT